MYREVPPPPALPAAVRGFVRCAWTSDETGPKRIVPDGCTDLVAAGDQVFVAGPDTTAWTSEFPPGTRVHGLRFRPGATAALLGVGADELRDSRIPLSRLRNRPGEALTDRILSAPDPAAELAAAAADLAPGPVAEDPLVERMLAQLSTGAGLSRPDRPCPAPVTKSDRQARRRFTLAVGYGPAVYRRVLRLQRAIALAPAIPDLAGLAAAAGYADQPHLTRECRALTGLTPGAYFTGRGPGS